MTKQELIDKLRSKESQLEKAKSESNSWNRGKYQKLSNAVLSKGFVSLLENEINGIHHKISELES
ncbi:hypothetical protein ETN89_11285 [Photobacterium damselae subsp. damselae]|uniref:hypothetical protein n=1 Tax=Photobacterium damselae TaxID=38293 RepID=UPI000A2F9A31|nr:hypothetical protein [Photobacterium damselae]ARR49607.1 hypothetical protein CAY62_08510 [Photobacterium damselae subsp. damselae]QAY35849.1 hypothetical protein ETN89_11285 [Photobacterium damselae subsp. damselae]